MDQAIQFVVSCGVVVPRSQIVGDGKATVAESAIVKQVVEGHLEQTEQDGELGQTEVDGAESGHDDER
jgi:hypothetical protein